MVKVAAINQHTKGTFLVDYEKWSPCGCSHTRHAIVIKTDKLTEAQALAYIAKHEA